MRLPTAASTGKRSVMCCASTGWRGAGLIHKADSDVPDGNSGLAFVMMKLHTPFYALERVMF
jgi:hypothetical protein